jgi:hypothetical protein
MILLGAAVTTVRLSTEATNIAHAEGNKWLLLKDRRTLMQFVYQPQELLDSSDSARLSEAKKALLSHRRRLIRSIAAAPLLLGLGFGLTTPFPFYCLVIAIVALVMLLVRGIL